MTTKSKIHDFMSIDSTRESCLRSTTQTKYDNYQSIDISSNSNKDEEKENNENVIRNKNYDITIRNYDSPVVDNDNDVRFSLRGLFQLAAKKSSRGPLSLIVVLSLILLLIGISYPTKNNVIPSSTHAVTKITTEARTKYMLPTTHFNPLFTLLYKPLLSHNPDHPPPLSKIAPYTLSIQPVTRQTSLPSPFFHRRYRTQQTSQQHQNGKNVVVSKPHTPLPTNSWYQNIMLSDSGIPTIENRVYTIPYIVDFVGPVPGLRLHLPSVDMGGDLVVQMSFVDRFGLTLGFISDKWEKEQKKKQKSPFSYELVLGDDENDVSTFSPLGTRVQWMDGGVVSPVARGMPYATMIYKRDDDTQKETIATVVAQIEVSKPPLIDSLRELTCGTAAEDEDDDVPEKLLVTKDLELYFGESDFTWLVFVSRPIMASCTTGSSSSAPFVLQFYDNDDSDNLLFDYPSDDDFIIRTALANNCTTGTNPSYCTRGHPQDRTSYAQLLRNHAKTYSYASSVKYAYPDGIDSSTTRNIVVTFDWGVRRMSTVTTTSSSETKKEEEEEEDELITYALPHHVDILRSVTDSSNTATGYCSPSLNGPVCIIKGQRWVLMEVVSPISFSFDRPPSAEHIPALVAAVNEDINFALPDYYMRGVGDTYFSGKMLAKLGRIIIIADELKRWADKYPYDNDDEEMKDSINALRSSQLPSSSVINDAVERLKAGIEVWFNGTAEAKYIYDSVWGGLVNCGCWFNGERQTCDNVYPECPSLVDPGLDFGNGFYNDHHFHYGYHIYASAVAAKFDPSWGIRNFESVLLYVRDIANPSPKDEYFPMFRHKDWYLGNSWASGIATLGGVPYLNGRNQESSSESIAAYEGIALFGLVMEEAFAARHNNDDARRQTAQHVSNLGQLLTAMELRSADRYWHVYDHAHRVYPLQYKPKVVGIMWNTMVQFQTWFGGAPYLVYGIQLLPLTTISERNFVLEWCFEFYNDFAESCEKDKVCDEQGWSVLQYGILATVGHKALAVNRTLGLDKSVFETAGGNGHSLSNTLYYIATRPSLSSPLDLTASKKSSSGELDCGCPTTCTTDVLSQIAGGFSCRDRMTYLINYQNMKDRDACRAVSEEFPDDCGQCNPSTCRHDDEEPSSGLLFDCGCPDTCTPFKTYSNVADGYTCHDRIAYLTNVEGLNQDAACRRVSSTEFPTECSGCDPERCYYEKPESEDDGDCRPCSKAICNEDGKRCQVMTAPYFCSMGPSRGGCSATPWQLSENGGGLCFECCKLSLYCGDD